jgi:hypothetical protein
MAYGDVTVFLAQLETCRRLLPDALTETAADIYGSASVRLFACRHSRAVMLASLVFRYHQQLMLASPLSSTTRRPE